MLKCNEVSQLIASGEAENLSWMKRMELRLHLMMCQHCRRYADQLKTLGSLARKAFESSAEDVAILTRLEEKIVQECFDHPSGKGNAG